jgi:PKD repeat protein
MTFKKLILLSVLTVLIGVGAVHALGYQFQLNTSSQTSSSAGSGETIPLKYNYTVGDHMTYNTTTAIMSMEQPPYTPGHPVGTPLAQDGTGTISTDIISFDGENYTISDTASISVDVYPMRPPISLTLTEKIDKTGHPLTILSGSPTELNSLLSGLNYIALGGVPMAEIIPAELTSLLGGLNSFGTFFLKDEAKVGETWQFPISELGNLSFGSIGNLNFTFGNVQNVTVPAGTYKVFSIVASGSNLATSFNIAGVSYSENISASGQEYLEYGTCRLIDSNFQENISYQMGGQNYTTITSIRVQLIQDIQTTTSPPSASSGTLRVFAFYAVKQPDGSCVGSFVQVPVTVIGPENHTGMTTTDRWNPLSFTVAPGEYSVSGTYDSATPQTASVNVSAGNYGDVLLNFGSSSPPPSADTDFSNPPGIAWINETVDFNATEGCDSYTWDFGDGNVATGSESMINHTYLSIGNYAVTLNVTSNGLWNAITKSITITFRADLNRDGTVNILDITILAKAFGSRPGDSDWNPIADIYADGVVNIRDVTIAAKDYGKSSGSGYTVIGTLSYAPVSAVYVGATVKSITPSLSPNPVGSFMFLTFNGQMSATFPAGFVVGDVVEISGNISFDTHSQTYVIDVTSMIDTT